MRGSRRPQVAAAESLYQRALTIREKALGQDHPDVADSLSHLALMAYYEEDYVTARRFDEESLTIWRTLGDKQGIALSLHRLGNVMLSEADSVSARALFVESLEIANELEYQWGFAWSLEDFARLAARNGEYQHALGLAGAATALRKAIGIPLPATEQAKFDQLLASAWKSLDIEVATALWAEGQSMTAAEALERFAKIV